ncbi:MAG: AAA family ATPase [Alloprevotella sp.]
MKYPIGIQDFEQIIQEGFAYVDKTAWVYKLAKEGHVYFLSRPRRFGKSLLVSTLKYYFQGRKDLFRGLAIDKLETEWAEYPVFHIDFNGGGYETDGELQKRITGYVETWEAQWGKSPIETDLGMRFSYVLQQAHEKTGRRAVVLVDEYDKPLLDVLDTGYTGLFNGKETKIEDIHRNILKGFYGVFKLAAPDLQFVLLTGVTKFSQVSVFSGFNQPEDISMSVDYEGLCGITKDELLSTFEEPIHELAAKFKVSYDEVLMRLKQKYDGYHFGEEMIDIFNPFSILNCLKSKRMQNFWFSSGTPTYLVRLLSHCNENINELVGKYYEASQFIDYKADVEQPLPMMYQSGYFTIKDYNERYSTYLLDFPNEEVRTGFIDAVASGYFKQGGAPASWVVNAATALESGDTATFEKLMTSLLSSVTYRFQRKQDAKECERYFQYTFYLIVQMIGFYNAVAEKETSEGRIDCVVECPDYVYIIEFKLNGSAEAALRQIEEKGYAKPYAADRRKVIALGINFSSEKGTIDGFMPVETRC